MIDGHTGRYRSSGSHPYSMGDKDAFVVAESSLELQIFSIAVRIGFSLVNATRILIYSSPVWIDADTDDTAFAVVTIERDTRLGASSDIADEHVIKEEGRAFEFRSPDDFKASLAHSS